jgi:hypothetical protein
MTGGIPGAPQNLEPWWGQTDPAFRTDFMNRALMTSVTL